ncbi:sulfatase-like hydrolase/transferase [Kitasatospora sp. NPDC059463]|uniref:sulfatase-like hydrolase/transferase n=1 Tax=unclassified Kitasatospora TaxID=2633591 RepID=UPI0036962FE4
MSSSRPNILWTVSEDCPPRFGCYGDPLATTPHLDGLAKRGTLFTNAHSPAPVCAPSRFALLTGVAPESHGPAHHMRARARLPEWMSTYPELLRELGYYCTNNAKTDYNSDADPQAVWDESSGTAHWRNRPAGSPFLAVFNYDPTHESSVFGRAEFTVDPAEVRLPAYLPDTPEIRGDFAHYYRHIAAMDAFVDRLLAELEEDGELDNTVVIHTSDHGGVNPRSKRWCYDEGLHVPLIVAAPERHAHRFPAPGTRVEAAVSTLRIPPTLVDLAGGTAPAHMRGESLARTRFDSAGELAFSMRNRMDERPDMIRTVRDARYRYIRNYAPHRPYGTHQAFAWLAAGYRSWETEHLAGRLDDAQSAFWREKPGVELYDCVADPDQIHNLAGHPAHAEAEKRLDDALRAHVLAVHDNGFLPEGSPAEGYDASRAAGAYPLARILDVADAVGRRDPALIPRFTTALADPDATVRRWGAVGLLALPVGTPTAEAVTALRAAAADDPGPHVRVAAAEAVGKHTGDVAAAALLADLAAPEYPEGVRLEALNALTALGPTAAAPHRAVVAAAAGEPLEYLGNAARYLLLRIDGRYTPHSTVLDLEGMLARAAAAGRAPGRPA